MIHMYGHYCALPSSAGWMICVLTNLNSCIKMINTSIDRMSWQVHTAAFSLQRYCWMSHLSPYITFLLMQSKLQGVKWDFFTNIYYSCTDRLIQTLSFTSILQLDWLFALLFPFGGNLSPHCNCIFLFYWF